MSTHMSTPGDLDWRIARRCESGACVAVARSGESVLIGNSNDLSAPVSKFTTEEWRTFLAGAKLGDFDGIA